MKAAVRAARVDLITSSLEELIGNAQAALDEIRRGAADTTLEVRVPAIARPAAPAAGWEVTVRWD
jgi:hypothetical protein